MSADQTLFSPINRGILVGDTVRQKGYTKLMIVQQTLADEIICGWLELNAESMILAKFTPSELELVRYGKS